MLSSNILSVIYSYINLSIINLFKASYLIKQTLHIVDYIIVYKARRSNKALKAKASN